MIFIPLILFSCTSNLFTSFLSPCFSFIPLILKVLSEAVSLSVSPPLNVVFFFVLALLCFCLCLAAFRFYPAAVQQTGFWSRSDGSYSPPAFCSRCTLLFSVCFCLSSLCFSVLMLRCHDGFKHWLMIPLSLWYTLIVFLPEPHHFLLHSFAFSWHFYLYLCSSNLQLTLVSFSKLSSRWVFVFQFNHCFVSISSWKSQNEPEKCLFSTCTGLNLSHTEINKPSSCGKLEMPTSSHIFFLRLYWSGTIWWESFPLSLGGWKQDAGRKSISMNSSCRPLSVSVNLCHASKEIPWLVYEFMQLISADW